MDGIIVVNKSAGITSHRVVQMIRRLFPGVRAGHTGTLDPTATGVLPVCLGRATRLSEYIIELPKTYRAEIVLGKTSDTEDAAGRITEEAAIPSLGRKQIETIISSFTGSIEQLAPLYSAVKYRGKPLYYWTRRGETVPRKIRKANIYSIDLLDFNPEREPHLVLDVHCSRGTYIRTLAADIGKAIGCGAYLSALNRSAVGPFTLKEALKIEEIENLLDSGSGDQVILKMDSALINFPRIDLNQDQVETLRQGKHLTPEQSKQLENYTADLPIRVYDPDGNFKALACRISTEDDFSLKTLKYLAD